MAGKQNKKSLLETLGESQVWKSIIRSGVPRTRRQRMHAVLGSVFLHLHPARLPKHAVKVGYTWCMGGLSFFLFVNLTITGILLKKSMIIFLIQSNPFYNGFEDII